MSLLVMEGVEVKTNEAKEIRVKLREMEKYLDKENHYGCFRELRSLQRHLQTQLKDVDLDEWTVEQIRT